MARRNLPAGLAALALSLFLLSGTAFAHGTHHKTTKPRSEPGTPETCVVHALPPSFIDQGEFETASSVADVIEVECEEVYAEKYVKVSANELYDRCDHRLVWGAPGGKTASGSGPSISIQLDNDGNASIVAFGGPSCAAGESLISAHLEVPPFTTVTTGFTVLPPQETKPGVFATPATKVEGEDFSDVATIIQVEFPPVFAEEPVDINDSQLYARCHVEKPFFLAMTAFGPEYVSFTEDATATLDNDGNAFVVILGGLSCAAGTSLIEASLENAPYTTYTTNFTIEPPQPTFPN